MEFEYVVFCDNESLIWVRTVTFWSPVGLTQEEQKAVYEHWDKTQRFINGCQLVSVETNPELALDLFRDGL